MSAFEDVRRMTFRELYRSAARAEAFAFAWSSRNTLDAIKQRLSDKEEALADPSPPSTSLAPGTSVRRYMEGFVGGLKDALSLLTSQSENGNSESDASRRLAASIYRSILEAKARNAAIYFTRTHSIDEISEWASEVERSTPAIFLVKAREMSIETDAAERVTDESTLRESIPFTESLNIYYQAYLSTLKEVLRAAYELGIQITVSTEVTC